MLLIVHKIWHGISPEWYRQVLTKINQNYICQQGNISLDNLWVLDLVRMSRSHVKGHRRGGVCVFWMLLVYLLFEKNSSRTDAPKRSYYSKLDALPANILFVSRFRSSYISRESHSKITENFGTKRYFIGWQSQTGRGNTMT